jgi:hypothetical protein
VTHFALAGDDPMFMLTAIIPATRKLLDRAGLSIDRLDAFEVNEAFASVVLAWMRATGADPDRVNRFGGAVALGHPVGASGGRLLGGRTGRYRRSLWVADHVRVRWHGQRYADRAALLRVRGAIAQEARNLHARIEEIQSSLQCPCPSRYGLKQLVSDNERRKIFADRRAQRKLFPPEEDLEEARRTARLDSFRKGSEVSARQRLANLHDKKRVADMGGPPLTAAQETSSDFWPFCIPLLRARVPTKK